MKGGSQVLEDIIWTCNDMNGDEFESRATSEKPQQMLSLAVLYHQWSDWCRRLRRIFRSREWATHAWYRSDPTWTWNQFVWICGVKFVPWIDWLRKFESMLICPYCTMSTRLTQLVGMHRFWMHHYDQSCMWCDVCWIFFVWTSIVPSHMFLSLQGAFC